MRSDVEFPSLGAKIRAWLYRPAASPAPVVVMAHGFSATRHMTLDRLAEAICAAGCAALLYDHRGFGASEGTPRFEVNPWVQARGYIDAVDFASRLEGIDRNRIAIWGDSFSAGVCVVVAAIEPRVAACVGQVPALGEKLPLADAGGDLFRELSRAVLSPDVLSFGRPLIGPLPVVSADQVRHPSALKPLTAFRWFIEYGGRLGSGWVNDVSVALGEAPMSWQPALAARHVTVPVLLIVSPQDEMARANPDVARHCFEVLRGPKEWHSIAGGHFGLLYFPSDLYKEAETVQLSFLRRHLIDR